MMRQIAWDVEAITKRDDAADLSTRARLVNFWLLSRDLILEAWAVLLHVCRRYPSYLLFGWLVVAGRWLLWDAMRKLWEGVLAACWLVGWIAIAVCKPCLAGAASALSSPHVTRGVAWAWEVSLREVTLASAGWILAAVGVCHLLHYLREIKEEVRREDQGDGGTTTGEQGRRNSSTTMTHFAILVAGVVLAACFFEITLGLSKGVSDSTVLGKTESVAAVDTGGTESQSSLSGTNIAEDDATKTQQAAEGVTVAGEEVVKSQSTIPSDLSEAENKSPETQRTIAGETIFKSPLSHPPEPSEAATEILKIRQSVAGEEVSKSQPIAAGNASTIGVQDLQPSDGTLNSSRDVGIVGRDGDLQNDDSTDEEAARKMVPTDEDAVSEEDSSPNEIWDDKPPNDLWDLLELAGWTVLAIGLLKVVMYLREVEQEIKDANVAEKKQREEGASKLEEERAARSARRKALFGEPRPLAECPLCMNAMPFDVEERRYFLCCGKTTCMSCYTHYAFNAEANRMRRQNDNGHNEPVDLPCPFCRCSEEMDLDEESVLSERIEKSELNGCFDHQAAFELGQHHYDSAYYGSDWKASAMKWWKKAAKHGNELAAYELALIYTGSEHAKFTVREQADLGKSYMEEAAIAGHPKARYWLGLHEMNQERAMSHFTLAARYGCKTSLDLVVKGYRSGIVTREDLDEVLRGHQDATPS